jgi:hypothetical protein
LKASLLAGNFYLQWLPLDDRDAEQGMAGLTVKIQDGIRRALDDARYKLDKRGVRRSVKSIVVEALEKWLDQHEGKMSGAENRPSGKANASLALNIPDELEKRLHREHLRRKKARIKPKKKRGIIEAAIIEWLLNGRFSPGVDLADSTRDGESD